MCLWSFLPSHSFMHSFICSPSNYLWSAYYIPEWAYECELNAWSHFKIIHHLLR